MWSVLIAAIMTGGWIAHGPFAAQADVAAAAERPAGPAELAKADWIDAGGAAALALMILAVSLLLLRQRQLKARLATASRIVENSTAFLYCLDGGGAMPMTFLAGNLAKFGYHPGEFRSEPEFYRSLIHPDDRVEAETLQRQLLRDGAVPRPIQFRLRAKDGSYRWFENQVTRVEGRPGSIQAVEGMIVDIHDRRQIEEQLRFANTLLTTEMETLPDAVLVVDRNGRAISYNQHFAAMWSLPRNLLDAGDDELLLKSCARSMKDPEQFLARIAYLYAHPHETGHEELETRDGRFIERHTAGLHDEHGRYLGRLWSFRDITSRKKAEAEIRQAASYDALTGLVNRRAFVEAVQREIGRAERGEKGFAVLHLDLDHFKDVNDALGHSAGDRLLCAVADRLRRSIRDTDMAARFSGDEFAILAAPINEPAEAAQLANTLRSAIEAPYSIQGNEICSGVTIGIAVYQPGEPHAERLLSHADVALYRAKAEGRGLCRFFTEAMDIDVRHRLSLTAELRQAIASGQLFLEYQPQIDIQSEKIIGVEALVRWRHPQRGVVSPGEFIGLAEKSTLIADLGQWVMQEACRQAKAWADAGARPIPIAVNVSPVQFKMIPDLAAEVAGILSASGVPPEQLEIELTESGLLEASREHALVVSRIREMGVRLAIDDFGTGYSSLDYLRRYPADRIKIAQDFVRLIISDAGSAVIVKATIGLARELGMTAIAEGVETPEQLELLRSWGCREVQGFYFAKPLGAEELLPLLRQGRILRSFLHVGEGPGPHWRQ